MCAHKVEQRIPGDSHPLPLYPVDKLVHSSLVDPLLQSPSVHPLRVHSCKPKVISENLLTMMLMLLFLLEELQTYSNRVSMICML